MKNHEVSAKPPKPAKMVSKNSSKAGKFPPSGPTGSVSSKPANYGNRNFGRDDHHGTTNVRSVPIRNKVSGPGGTKHISTMVTKPAALGAYSKDGMSGNGAASPPWGLGPNDQDADDRVSPVFKSVIPDSKGNAGGFS